MRDGPDVPVHRLVESQPEHALPNPCQGARSDVQRHGITRRVDVNTIANRTLISNETNGRRLSPAATGRGVWH